MPTIILVHHRDILVMRQTENSLILPDLRIIGFDPLAISLMPR